MSLNFHTYYIPAEFFDMCLKESCFPDWWEVSSVVPVFKNVGERSTAKNYCPVSFLSVVGKVIEKLLSNRQLQVVLDEKSSQEYPVNARVP